MQAGSSNKYEGLNECLPNSYPKGGGIIITIGSSNKKHSSNNIKMRKKPIRKTANWCRNYLET